MNQYLPILVDKGLMFLAGLIGISLGFGWIKNAQLEKSPRLCNLLKFGGCFLLIYSTWMAFVGVNHLHNNQFTINWEKYSTKDGEYSIEFPNAPEELTKKISISPNKDIKVHFAVLGIPSLKTVYASSYTVLPDEIRNLSEDDYIRGKISDIKNSLDPNSIEFHRLEKDSPAWVISGESKNIKTVVNYFIHKGRAYDVIVTFPKSEDIPKEAERFFNSFDCWQSQ